MDSILKLENVSKVYGNNVVVNNVNFDIKKGSVCGLLGPNGAGKTTIMKIIMNELKCESGSVYYNKQLKIKYLQDVPNFYEFYSVEEYLFFLLDIAYYDKDKNIRVNEILELLNLGDHKDKRIKKLSRGLRQKVGIASVIIDEPDVLILDEPVSALDPIGRKEIFDLISSLRGKVTIIFSSHILTDIERVCDHVILINKGKILLNSDIKSLSLDKQTLLITFRNREDLLKIKENMDVSVRFNTNIENCLEVDGEDMRELQKKIFKVLIKNEVSVKGLSIKRDSLEEIFLREVRNNG